MSKGKEKREEERTGKIRERDRVKGGRSERRRECERLERGIE